HEVLDQATAARTAAELEAALRRLQAALAAGGRTVDDSHAPEYWTLSDRAGNRVCIVSWPDGATREGGA
ncbi:MAG: hypothetical protein J7601_09310, partial [Chloroflexi bacterium]|nr:hypothetical protein [Chloroflexota bacterium]